MRQKSMTFNDPAENGIVVPARAAYFPPDSLGKRHSLSVLPLSQRAYVFIERDRNKS